MSQQPCVVIATPAFGGQVTTGYTKALVHTILDLAARGVRVGLDLRAGISLVHFARSFLAAAFLANAEATHLLFIDADLEWRPDDVLKLLAHDVPLVGATYRIKRPNLEFAIEPLAGPAPFLNGRVEVNSLPGGFMLIKREVFLRLIECYPESKVAATRAAGGPDKEKGGERRWLYEFFPTKLIDGMLEPEDYGFCKLCRDPGFQVWLDPTIQLTHYGAYGFTADPMVLMTPEPQPAAEVA